MTRRTDIRKLLADEAARFERAKDRPARRPYGRPPVPVGERGQVYAIRIPLERLEEFRALAERRGEAPTALMRAWLLERLDRERARVGEDAPAYRARTRAAGARAKRATGGKSRPNAGASRRRG
jgi:hypothetical protein